MNNGNDPKQEELTRLAVDFAQLDREPTPDRFYQSIQVGGLGVATVASARALPQLGIVMVLVCLGVLTSKGISVYFDDRQRWGEFVLVTTVLVGLTALGFADRIAVALNKNNDQPSTQPRIQLARD